MVQKRRWLVRKKEHEDAERSHLPKKEKKKKDFTEQLLQNIRSFDLELFISAVIMWHPGIRYTHKWVWTF